MFKTTAIALTLLITSLTAYAEEDGLLLEEMPDFSKIEEKKARIKKKLDYSANVIVMFVDRCASNMMAYMPNASNPIKTSCFKDVLMSYGSI